ncbi:DUF3750 domain-containing protein [Jannaschia seohaensis]|uniref:Uncharacterized protein DUF3750 n=1 Tax=Jannaschia seohaensis TaxID=475081 RepID=A0A2Y9A6K9_9RHOB|nr:DUF3750 domain-containing protein [Jannaschia seohaensis]PWJ21961.1 uncharacterized protein DUF3750 [Jannaschia seohaensis]SSA38239.1 Protein of unknown function [Jannaschia seohaensis]
MRRMIRALLLWPMGLFAVFFLLPALLASLWWAVQDRPSSWRAADWSASGLLPAAAEMPEAAIHVLAARTGGAKGALSVHSWIVYKEAGADRWTRAEVVGWGTPLRRDAYAPDARWYSNAPGFVGSVTGPEAAALIPRIEASIRDYPWARRGDYGIWPGPNSNTFVAHILREVPEIGLTLPPHAVGRDFTGRGPVVTWDAGGDWHLSWSGLAGLSAGPRTGLELHLLGQVFGVDVLRPALKLPGIGRVGVPFS